MSPSFLCGVMDDTEKSVGRYNVAERWTLLGLTFVTSLLDEHLACSAIAHPQDVDATLHVAQLHAVDVVDGFDGGVVL